MSIAPRAVAQPRSRVLAATIRQAWQSDILPRLLCSPSPLRSIARGWHSRPTALVLPKPQAPSSPLSATGDDRHSPTVDSPTAMPQLALIVFRLLAAWLITQPGSQLSDRAMQIRPRALAIIVLHHPLRRRSLTLACCERRPKCSSARRRSAPPLIITSPSCSHSARIAANAKAGCARVPSMLRRATVMHTPYSHVGGHGDSCLAFTCHDRRKTGG
ncbi:hypothetical protein BC628DRAFT_1188237 [Trametes gibbosa]|nr:hypothetical protein BC628DRAFT_1188237 [Trametes gibbosa]